MVGVWVAGMSCSGWEYRYEKWTPDQRSTVGGDAGAVVTSALHPRSLMLLTLGIKRFFASAATSDGLGLELPPGMVRVGRLGELRVGWREQNRPTIARKRLGYKISGMEAMGAALDVL